MWRYAWFWKDKVEDYSKTIDIKFLKKYWYLDEWVEYKSWWLYWKRNWEDNWNIGVVVNKNETSWFVRVHFTQTNNYWEKNDLDYNITLVTTPCNYWGVRWWFLCPCRWNRCSILYLQSNWIFASRKTLDLCYDSQMKSGFTRSLEKLFWPRYEDVEELRKSIKYPYRNWKPTRKQRKLEKMISKVPSLEDELKLEEMYLR